MRELHVFESISLDGYYRSASGDMTWAYRGADDPEFAAYVAGNASAGGDSELLMGRATYELMQAYWPTEAALKQAPAVAKKMNDAVKHVASRTLRELGWSGARILDGELIAAVRRLKEGGRGSIVVLGSGSLVAPLAKAGLVDSFQLVVLPIALGAGQTLFAGAGEVGLKLVASRAFANGRVALRYERAA